MMKKIDVSFNWNFLYASLPPLCLIKSHRYVRRVCFHLLCITSSGNCRQHLHLLSWRLKRSSFLSCFLCSSPVPSWWLSVTLTGMCLCLSCNGDPQPGHIPQVWSQKCLSKSHGHQKSILWFLLVCLSAQVPQNSCSPLHCISHSLLLGAVFEVLKWRSVPSSKTWLKSLNSMGFKEIYASRNFNSLGTRMLKKLLMS